MRFRTVSSAQPIQTQISSDILNLPGNSEMDHCSAMPVKSVQSLEGIPSTGKGYIQGRQEDK
jgi:hypothetical protein